MRLDRGTLLIALAATVLAVRLATTGGAVAAVIGAVAAGVVAAALWQLRLDWLARAAHVAELEKKEKLYALPGPAREGGVAQFLRPEEEVVPFWPRPELEELLTWVASEQHVAVQLITGEAGAGKTRLARQLASQADDIGFWTWWVKVGAEQTAVQAAIDSGNPALLIVDYAETRSGLRELLSEVVSDPSETAIRVLLLARSAGEWWQQLIIASEYQSSELLAAVQPIILGPVTSRSNEPEVFQQALVAFAAKMGISCPDVEMPTASDAVVLVIHAAALLAVLDSATEGPAVDMSPERADVLAGLLRHESRYWQQSQAACGLDLTPQVLRRAVAAGCLVGADDENSATTLLEIFPDLADPATRRKAVRWLHDLYPVGSPAADQYEWVGSLQPDLIVEQLVVTVLSQSPDLIPALFRGLTGRRATRALTILARAVLNSSAALNQLDLALKSNLENLVIPALDVAVKTNPAVGTVIRDLLSSEEPTAPLLERIAYALPSSSVTLADTAAIVLGHLAESTVKDTVQHSRWLTGLSTWLAALGRLEDALAVSEEAVTTYRTLARDRPEAFLPELAFALNNHCTHLAALGRQEDALAASEEAVSIYRELASDRPAAFMSNLAAATGNRPTRLAALGRQEDALAANEEVLTIYRQLARDQPDRFLPDLASALSNQALFLAAMGRPDDALTASEQAISIRRKLARDQPDASLPDLAISLNNHAVLLATVGRRDDALSVIEEAVSIRRKLARDRPEAFLPSLAKSLSNNSARLAALGRRDDALLMSEEAVSIYRTLVRDRPDVYLPHLATALDRLAPSLVMLGRLEEAVATSEEAVSISRKLARDQPGVFLHDLANSLTNHAGCLVELGRPEDALSASEEAVSISRQLVRDRSDVYLPKLATALNNHSRFLAALGRLDDALAVIEEAVTIRRALADASPDAFLSDLALSIRNLAESLGAVGRIDDAQAALEEAAILRDQAPERFDDFRYST